LTPENRAAIERSKELVQFRKFDSAAEALEQRIRSAVAPFDRVCLLLALGNVHVTANRYREALGAYSDGQQIARDHGFTQMLSLLSWSRMNIYLLMGNQPAARESIDPVLQLPKSQVPPATYIFAARCEPNPRRAFEFCLRGIRATHAALDHRAESYGWNVLGKLYMA
jgi:hypothetical protein